MRLIADGILFSQIDNIFQSYFDEQSKQAAANLKEDTI